jgi:hypothetical protein
LQLLLRKPHADLLHRLKMRRVEEKEECRSVKRKKNRRKEQGTRGSRMAWPTLEQTK